MVDMEDGTPFKGLRQKHAIWGSCSASSARILGSVYLKRDNKKQSSWEEERLKRKGGKQIRITIRIDRRKVNKTVFMNTQARENIKGKRVPSLDLTSGRKCLECALNSFFLSMIAETWRQRHEGEELSCLLHCTRKTEKESTVERKKKEEIEGKRRCTGFIFYILTGILSKATNDSTNSLKISFILTDFMKGFEESSSSHLSIAVMVSGGNGEGRKKHDEYRGERYTLLQNGSKRGETALEHNLHRKHRKLEKEHLHPPVHLANVFS